MECDEEKDRTICGKMSGMPASESRTAEISRTPSTITDTRIEVGACHNEFRHCATPQSKGNNAVWVVIDRITKLAYFIPFERDNLRNCWRTST